MTVVAFTTMERSMYEVPKVAAAVTKVVEVVIISVAVATSTVTLSMKQRNALKKRRTR